MKAKMDERMTEKMKNNTKCFLEEKMNKKVIKMEDAKKRQKNRE